MGRPVRQSFIRTFGVWAAAAGLAGALLLLVFAIPSRATFSGHDGLIAYSTGNGEEEPYAVHTIRPDGTHHRRLLGPTTRNPGGPEGPQWSHDGTKLLFGAHPDREGTRAGSLWYWSVSDKQVRRIPLGLGTVFIWGYAWAPDGRRLVVAVSEPRTVGSAPMLYTISIDGTHRRALRHGTNPEWSNDGRRIVFERTSWQFAGTSGIFVIQPNKRGFRQLSSGPDSSPSISPDARRVLFVRDIEVPLRPAGEQRSEWRTVDISGGRERVVAVHRGDSEFIYGAPLWTPDGNRLAATRSARDPSASSPVPAGVSLVTLDRRGGDERVAFKFPKDPLGPGRFSWQPR